MRRSIAFAMLLPSAFLPATPASAEAETSVTIAGTAQSGAALTVTGASTYGDQPAVLLGTDPANDVQQSGPSQLGLDLVGASMATTTDGHLSLRWTMSELPPVVGGMPQANYNWTFCVNAPGEPAETASCWWVTGARTNWLIPNPDPWLSVWRCLNTGAYPCDGTEVTDITGTLTFDVATTSVTATLRMSDLGGDAGYEVVPMVGYSFLQGSVWTGESLWYGFVFRDQIAYESSYVIPGTDVTLAIGAPGQDPTQVSYAANADVAPDGAYSGTLDVGGMSGVHGVYARACFGANNCGYATRDVEIGPPTV